jgi:nitrite reductase (NADH) large subunit
MQFTCTVCAYVHEGAEPPAACPVCGVGPELFEPVGAQPAPPATPPAAPTATGATDAWNCTVCAYVHEGAEPPEICPVCGVGPELFEAVAPAAPPAFSASSAPAAPPAAEPADPEAWRIVIVGAGVAGCQAALSARESDPLASITLVSSEPGLPYRRIDLTRLLAGQVQDENMTMYGEDQLSQQRIQRVLGQARSIDLEGRVLRTSDGRSLGYDRLVLANGAHAFVPPIPGVQRDGVTVLRTLDHARRILQRCREGGHVVVIGGGLLGLETAVGLAARGARVAVVEGQPWLLPRQLVREAAALLEARLRRLGVEVICSARIAGILGDESVYAVALEGDRELPAEQVVLSTGIRPNSQLASRAGLEAGPRGVMVDVSMRCSDPHVLAAGDVADVQGSNWGLWPVAQEQGRVAGLVATGVHAAFEPPPPAAMLKVLDVPVASIGEVHAEGEDVEVFIDQGPDRYVRLAARQGRLVGACLYGDIALAGPVRRAIESGQTIGELTGFVQRSIDG